MTPMSKSETIGRTIGAVATAVSHRNSEIPKLSISGAIRQSLFGN